MGLVRVFCAERKSRSITSLCIVIGPPCFGIWTLSDGCSLGAFFEGQRCVSSLEKEDQEGFGF